MYAISKFYKPGNDLMFPAIPAASPTAAIAEAIRRHGPGKYTATLLGAPNPAGKPPRCSRCDRLIPSGLQCWTCRDLERGDDSFRFSEDL